MTDQAVVRATDAALIGAPLDGGPERRLVAAVALLRADGAALLQHRDDRPGLRAADQWVFPGGHCEAGEHPAACALREFEEETEYRCAGLDWLATLRDDFMPGWPADLIVVFWTPYDGVQAHRCREGQALAFVPREDAGRYAIPPYQLALWDLALTRMRQRRHD